MDDREVMRELIRHQWVRANGGPRISVLVGDAQRAADIWATWLRLGGRTAAPDGVWFAQPRNPPAGWFDANARQAARLVEERPQLPVGLAVERAVVDAWRNGRDDRVGALVREGTIELRAAPAARAPGRTPAKPSQRTPPPPAIGLGMIDTPRSLAEWTLFEALEQTAATAGKFRLNQHMPVRFGGSDVEVDLLARDERIAIEIDGVHHFADPDCYRRDRRKDALLQAYGLAVLRVLADDVLADPRDAVRMVCELMAHRKRRHR